ncbi:hypothetical protein [Pseudomonas synxantha]|uniref:hypothetical protein n=1 Tax=Pseudomonas synxantha TaxID=47883 RepID=UPI00345D5099
MQYHSINPGDRNLELLRAIQKATSLADHVLLVSPSSIKGLNDQLEKIFGKKFISALFKERRVPVSLDDGRTCTYYLSTTDTKCPFPSGVVVLPWASLQTVYWAIKNHQSSHTVFVPNEDFKSSVRGVGKDELTLYLQDYPHSIQY